MRRRGHIRLFLFATLVWVGFWVGGLPDYYQQYSSGFMAVFDLVVLLPVTGVAHLVLSGVKPHRRRRVALWIAFYFTVPLAVYDWLYCGLYLGQGLEFVVSHWYLSIYYVILWVLLPAIAWRLNRRG